MSVGLRAAYPGFGLICRPEGLHGYIQCRGRGSWRLRLVVRFDQRPMHVFRTLTRWAPPASRRHQISLGAFLWTSLVVAFSLLLNPLASGAIRFGVVTCLSGGLSTFGISSAQGAKLAAEEINSAGGVLHQPLSLIVDDNQSKPGETARIVRKFLTQDRVVAILGDLTSSFTMEAAPLAQNAYVPLLTPTATHKDITPIENFIFLSCFTDPFTRLRIPRLPLSHVDARMTVIMKYINR